MRNGKNNDETMRKQHGIWKNGGNDNGWQEWW
jgi:hypothetical protein